MAEYFDREHDRTFTRVYKAETPDILQSFLRFDEAVFAAEGREIPLKYRELIAVAVGISTQCVYCIDGHTQRAIKAGATQAELAEAAWVVDRDPRGRRLRARTPRLQVRRPVGAPALSRRLPARACDAG